MNFRASESDNYSNELGWITPIAERDKIGARLNNDVYETTCIDMFGDSFTFSLDVSNNEAWPKKLSVLLDCRVYNYGVSAYGSDQILQRRARVHFDWSRGAS